MISFNHLYSASVASFLYFAFWLNALSAEVCRGPLNTPTDLGLLPDGVVPTLLELPEPGIKGPHPLYKPKKDSLVPGKDPLCAAVKAGSVHNHNHKGASEQCDYDVEYADNGDSMGILVRDSVQALLTNGTPLTTKSVFGKHYNVGPAQMNFGNKPLDRDGDGKKLGGIIFDSGSSYTYFTNRAYGFSLSAVKVNLSGKQLEQDSSDSFLPLCWRNKKGFRAATQRRVLHSSQPLAEQLVALEDSSVFHRNTLEETISCAQELGKAVCSSSSYFLPALGIYQENICMIPT